MIDFHCNICNQKLSVPNEYLGKAVKCLACGNILKAVPEVKIEPADQQAAETQTPSAETSELKKTQTSPPAMGTPASNSALPGRKNVYVIAGLILICGFTVFSFTRQSSPVGKKPVTPHTSKAIPSSIKKPMNIKVTPAAKPVPIVSPAATPPKAVETPKKMPPVSSPPPQTLVPAPQPVRPTAQVTPIAEPDTAKNVPASPAGKDTDNPQKVPEKSAQIEALKKIRNLYKNEYRKSNPQDREALAGELLRQGIETHDDAAAAYVMLRESMELAANAGNLEAALAAAKELSTRYAIDRFEVKMDAITMTGETNRDADSAGNTSKALMQLTDEAIAADNYKIAGKCAAAALKYAILSKDDGLTAHTRSKPVEVKKLAGEFESLKEARKILATNKDDPRACLAMGKFLCLAKGNWEKGLSFLAKGSDEGLKTLAKKELAHPSDSRTQVELGDMWWDLSDGVKDKILQTRYKRRAAYWYQQGNGELSGIAKTRVEKRIQEVDKANSFMPRERISKRRVVNLLKMIDLQKDPMDGFWKKNRNGELISDNRVTRIDIPYQPPEEYDFRVTFTRIDRNDAIMLMLSNPSAQSHFTWVIGGWGNTVSGFTLLENKAADNNPTTVRKPQWLLNRNKYLATVQVRKDRVRAFLNDELITEWKTNYTELTPEPWHDLRNKTHLGVGSWSSPTIFHKIEVLEISGPGTTEVRTAATKLSRNK